MADRVEILGTPFDRVNMRQAVTRIVTRFDRGERTCIITANPEFVMHARRERDLADVVRDADLVVADGTGVVLGSRLLGTPLARVPGRRLVDQLMPSLAERGASLFLLGAAPGVAELAAMVLQQREPRLRIAGTYAGDAGDDTDTVARVAAAAPDVLLVAFGQPKQERWIARNLASLPSVRLAMGVGGVFDQLAGLRRVPPAFLHRVGLEWLWRLVIEPSRWRRQRVLPVFAALVLRQRLIGR